MNNQYIVSARKYRPTSFQSVVGQKSLTTTLKNAIQNNKLAHAYLFCGPRGVGKTSCARIFAKTINCLHPKAGGEACNKCESCLAFNENRSYNIYELDAASNNSIDDIRSLTDQVRIPTQIGNYKVYIIDEVHMLSSQAFNAFLKTLEEPPHYAIFILATTEKHKIIPTILSRCQIYDFARITVNDIVEYLEYVAKSENVSIEKEALNIIAQKADGGMRDALSIFDQMVSFSCGNITYQSVIDNFNILDYEYYFRLITALLAGNVNQSLLILDEVLQKGFDNQQILSGLADCFRDILVCQNPQTIVLLEMGDAIKEKYRQMAQQCTDEFLYKALEQINEFDLNYRYSKNKRLLLELLLITICRFNHQPKIMVDDKKKIEQPQSDSSQLQEAIFPIKNNSPLDNYSLPENSHLRISIKTSCSEQQEKEIETSQLIIPQEKLNESFTQEALEAAWKDYAAKEEDIHLRNTMLNVSPHLHENNYIHIVVFNPDQRNKLNDRAAEIKHFLSTRLHNMHIELKILITENKEKYQPYDRHEIFQVMAEKNPTIISLVKEFNLKLS